jgi:hypothetical protein
LINPTLPSVASVDCMSREELQELRLRVESEIRSIKLRLESLDDPEAALRAKKALSYRVALNSRILARLSAFKAERRQVDLLRKESSDGFRTAALRLLDAETFAAIERAASSEGGDR